MSELLTVGTLRAKLEEQFASSQRREAAANKMLSDTIASTSAKTKAIVDEAERFAASCTTRVAAVRDISNERLRDGALVMWSAVCVFNLICS